MIAPDASEIEYLVAIYGSISVKAAAGVDINIISSIPKVNFLKKSICHLFGLNLEKRKLGHVMSGSHLINRRTVCDLKIYSAYLRTGDSPNVCDGYIRVNDDQLPTYKSFFVNLSPEEVIDLIKISLQNIISREINGDKFVIVGDSLSKFQIRTVINALTGDLVTSYPLLRGAEHVKRDVELLLLSYIKINYNPCYPNVEVREVTDVALISREFGEVNVGLKCVNLDTVSLSYQYWNVSYNNGELRKPFMQNSLLTDKCIKKLRKMPKGWPVREINILHSIDKIYLPESTIQKCFVEHRSKCFPKCLSDRDIILKLKEGISNFNFLLNDSCKNDFLNIKAVDKLNKDSGKLNEKFSIDFYKDKPSCRLVDPWENCDCPIISNKSKVSSKYALQLMANNLFCSGSMSTGGDFFYTEVLVPHVTLCDNSLHFRVTCNSNCQMNTFTFSMHIDVRTGEITELSCH